MLRIVLGLLILMLSCSPPQLLGTWASKSEWVTFQKDHVFLSGYGDAPAITKWYTVQTYRDYPWHHGYVNRYGPGEDTLHYDLILFSYPGVGLVPAFEYVLSSDTLLLNSLPPDSAGWLLLLRKK
jgi:hypothetical protein